MYSQNYPPQPHPQKTQASDLPCGRGNNGSGPGYGGGGNGNIPPPVGLCLPINDYLLPLFIAGIVFGVYKIRTLERLS